MRFDELTAPISADSDCGDPDIANDPAFQELRLAIEGKPGSQMGDSVIPEQPPDYPRSIALSTELLGKSKHLSLLVMTCRAAAGVDGFEGMADALNLFESTVADHWEELHPTADEDDPDDPWWERINLLRELTDSPATVDTLHRARLVDVRHIGAFSCRDIDIAAGRLSVSDEEKERCNSNLIRGAFSETPTESLQQTAAAIDESVQRLQSLSTALNDKIGADAPSFDALIEKIKQFRQLFSEFAGESIEQAAVEEPADVSQAESPAEVASVAAAPAAAAAKVGNFTGRDQVAAALDSVMRFYKHHEPSSPVPVLLGRAREMVYKSFFDLLRELAPQHKDNFRSLMQALNEDPLRFLIEDSYNSFLNGQTFDVPDEPAAVSDDSGAGSSADDSADSAAAVVVESRDEVIATLAQIQAFFETNEPSSPVPLIVQKVRNLVPKNFMDLLSEFDAPPEPQADA